MGAQPGPPARQQPPAKRKRKPLTIVNPQTNTVLDLTPPAVKATLPAFSAKLEDEVQFR